MLEFNTGPKPQAPEDQTATPFSSAGFFEIVVDEKIENPKRADPFRNEVGALLTNADLLHRNNEKDLAIHLVRQSLYLNSSHPSALRRLSDWMVDRKHLPIKIKALEALIKADMSFETVTRLAHCYYQAGEDQLAKGTYLDALGLLVDESKELFEIYKNLGNIALKERDFDAAEEYYNKAFTIQPNSDVLAVNLGTLSIQQGQAEEALTRFRGALSINPANDKAWVGLAMVHNEKGDFVLARGNLQTALDANPKNRTAVHLLANWAIRDHELSSATQALENYLGYQDCDKEMSLLLIHIFCLRGQMTEALLEVERVLLWEPQDQELQKIEREIRNARGF